MATEQVTASVTAYPRIARLRAVGEYFLAIYRRTWRGSVINRFLTPLLFLLAMGLGLGSLVDDHSGGVNGVPYLAYVVPAIVVFNAMLVAANESTYQVLGHFKWNQMYHAMVATRLGVTDVLLGHLLVVTMHQIFAATVFVLVAAPFGPFTSLSALWCIPAAVVTGMAFAVPIFAFTATQDGDNGFNILYRWIVTPLMLFSGTFFPVEALPVWMQPIAWVTPLWHGVELARSASLGALVAGPALLHLGALLVFIGIGWLLAVRTFTRRLVV